MLTKVKPAFQLKDLSLLHEQCYSDGKWVDADDMKTIAVYNPADGQPIGTVPNMGAVETRRAIEAANAALPAWRAKTAKERSVILRKWFELMMVNLSGSNSPSLGTHTFAVVFGFDTPRLAAGSFIP